MIGTKVIDIVITALVMIFLFYLLVFIVFKDQIYQYYVLSDECDIIYGEDNWKMQTIDINESKVGVFGWVYTCAYENASWKLSPFSSS